MFHQHSLEKERIMKHYKKTLLSILLAGCSAWSVSVQAGTELSRAAIDGNLAAVKARIAAGENINEYDKWGWTPLHWAVYFRSLPVTEFLLEKGADPNIATTKGYRSMKAGCTPLIISGYYGLANFAEILLKHGAKVDLTDSSGIDALGYAKQFQFTDVVELIERHKK
jgi:ankyrin repeat protein